HAVISDCATLASTYLNAPAKAEGVQSATGPIVADEIELNPGQSGGGEDNEFSGTVQSENCPSSIVVQRNDSTDVTVNLNPSTNIEIEDLDNSSSATCADIPLNAKVQVEGVTQPDGSVDAARVQVQLTRTESHGTITGLSCDATPPSFAFTPNGSSTAVTVTIGPTTEIEAGDNDAASCADLATGAAVVEGRVQTDGSIAASEIEQELNDDGGGDGSGGGEGVGGGD
ncbi:MAG TPA: DUF5666 domain-containing protein, partial [Candidatus Binataceae bacterium]|nr:DUF5666 domain-containing protein [Candidatus Binataceae bacterium]